MAQSCWRRCCWISSSSAERAETTLCWLWMIMKTSLLLVVTGLFTVIGFARNVNASDAVSLAGQWRFALDRDDIGVEKRWFGQKLTDQIKLPGSLQEQGFGDPPSAQTP